MLYSLKKIEIPKTYNDAIRLLNKPKSIIFGGGTYIVPNKNAKIKNLIDINKIVNKSIADKENSAIIGGGASIQNIIDKLSEYKSLTESAQYSSYSKNIRNQRTVGGEIAQKRVQSELFTYLVALNPILEVRMPKKKTVYLRNWNGKGIINKIIISKTDLISSGIERFSVIPSAPAFVIVAVVRRALELDFIISGKIKKISGHTIKVADFSKNNLKNIINESVKHFRNDQYGSLYYKKLIIETGIQRAVEKI